MKYRHYAPKAELIIVEGAQAAVVSKINELTADNEKKGIVTEFLMLVVILGKVIC